MSLKKYVKPKRKSLSQALLLEEAEKLAKFNTIKGNVQTSRCGLRVNKLNNINPNTTISKRKNISQILKKNNQGRIMNSIFVRPLAMQTSWLNIYDKAMAEDLTWQKILYSYSARLL